MAASSTTPFTEAVFDEHGAAERAHIEAGRAQRLHGLGDAKQLPWCGIALSGGGIRSACLGLGVLQVLAENDLLRRFDYISTVSGGGYIGGALQWWWARGPRNHLNTTQVTFGMGAQNFPFGPPDPALAQTNADPVQTRAIANLAFLRAHGSYLTPGNGLTLWSMLVVLVRTVALSLLIWVPLLTGGFILLHGLDQFLEQWADRQSWIRPLGNLVTAYWQTLPCDFGGDCAFHFRAVYAVALYGLMAVIALFLLASVVYALLSRIPQEKTVPKPITSVFGVIALMAIAGIAWLIYGVEAPKPWEFVLLLLLGLLSLVVLVRAAIDALPATSESASYYLRRTSDRVLGRYFWLVPLLLTIGSLPLLPYAMYPQSAASNSVAGIVSVLSGVGSALYGYYMFVKNLTPGTTGRIIAPLCAAIYLYGTLVLGYWLSIAVIQRPDLLPIPVFWVQVVAISIFVVAVVMCLISNINYVGLHRFYRDRLMEAFMPTDHSVAVMKVEDSPMADGLSVETLRTSSLPDPAEPAHVPKPYPLINTNVILVRDDYQKFASRGGANFLISPLFVGSAATGWVSTEDYTRDHGPLTLPTSIAASGAAASASAGFMGKGITMNRLVAAVMSLLNIRLGLWIFNPAVRRRKRRLLPRSLPTFLNPGLWIGIFGQGHRRTDKLIELSDGGHFENLGLYELVRRKLSLIIVVDGEADPNIGLASLVSARNRIEQDFKAQLKFFDKRGPELLVMHPRLGYPLGVKQAISPYIVAELTYDDGSVGTLIYIKSNITPQLDFATSGYLASNPDFPHQTTADQFFSPDQFEAYRNLGIESARKMVDALQLTHSIARPAQIPVIYQMSGPVFDPGN